MSATNRTRASFFVWGLCISLFAALPIGASATAQLQEVAPGYESIPVILAGDHQYPPFHFLDSHGNPTGFDVELFRAIAKRKKLAADIQLGDWASKLKQLELGKVEVIPMFISKERQKRYLFSKPFMTRHHLLFGDAQSQYLSSLSELQGQRVAVQYGGLAWEALRGMPKNINIVIIPVNFESEALASVSRGEADYALVPTTIGYSAILQRNLRHIKAVSPPLLQREYAFAVTTHRPDLVQILNEGLMEVKLSGEYDKLYMEWLANLTPPRESYRSGMRTGLWAAVPLLLFTIIVLFWWRQAKYKAALEAERANREAVSRATAEAQALYLAFHDAITGLPNRNSFDKSISTKLNEAQGCTLVRFDLLGLEMIHAVAGNEMGHEVLKAVGERLIHHYGRGSVADMSHGKFLVVFEGTTNMNDATQKTHALIKLVNERYQLDELPIDLRCRAGVALYPQHAKKGEELIRAAELACLAAHESRQAWCFFQSALMPDARNLTLLADLQDAIFDGTLGYALQPQLDLQTQKIIGAELLVRWDHPRFGSLPPNQFVPLAEKTGVINQMTMYLVLKAIKHFREWKREGIHVSISVNVSSNDLADETLVNAIIDQCDDVCGMLVLELTETEVMRDMERVLASVEKLRPKGIRISLDDFGTGYSSLSYLQRLKPDELKIDRSFITKLSGSPSDQSIVRSIILLAHELDAKVVAEGIEDTASLALLKNQGCDIGQGFAIARPMPVEEFISRTDLARYRSALEC